MMWALMWMPDPDEYRDEIDYLGVYEYPELAFRMVPRYSRLSWSFDGDGWSSERLTHRDEKGQFYITRQR